jgi:hypothetical protein
MCVLLARLVHDPLAHPPARPNQAPESPNRHAASASDAESPMTNDWARLIPWSLAASS